MMNELSIKAAIPNHHKLTGSKQAKFIVSEFWRLHVWNTGVGRTTVSLKALGEDTFLSLRIFWWLQTILGTPCSRSITLLSASITALCSPCVLSLGPNFFFLSGTPVILDLVLIQYDLIVTWLHLLRPYFQIRSHF